MISSSKSAQSIGSAGAQVISDATVPLEMLLSIESASTPHSLRRLMRARLFTKFAKGNPQAQNSDEACFHDSAQPQALHVSTKYRPCRSQTSYARSSHTHREVPSCLMHIGQTIRCTSRTTRRGRMTFPNRMPSSCGQAPRTCEPRAIKALSNLVVSHAISGTAAVTAGIDFSIGRKSHAERFRCATRLT